MTLVYHLSNYRAALGRPHLILCLHRPIFHIQIHTDTHFAHMTRGVFYRWMAVGVFFFFSLPLFPALHAIYRRGLLPILKYTSTEKENRHPQTISSL